MKKAAILKTVSGGILAALVLSGVSYAQEIEEIIVTAQKREQAEFDVPLAIDVYTEDMLYKAGISSVADLGKLPAISFGETFNHAAGNMTMRGITQHAGGDPVVGLYLDEMAWGIPGFGYYPLGAGIYDIERVEVQKGPQGTLWGQGSMGGTVRVITRDPDASAGVGGSFRLSGATTDNGDPSYSGEFAVNLPIIEHELAARFVYSRREKGGWIESFDESATAPANNWALDEDEAVDDNANDKSSTDARIKILYTPNEDLSVKLSYWYADFDDTNGVTTSTINPGDFLWSGGGVDTKNTNKTDGSSLAVSYDFGGVIVQNTLSSLEMEMGQRFREGGIFADIIANGEALTNELRIISDIDSWVSWIAGVYYRDAESTFLSDIILFGNLQFARSIDTLDSKSYSVFGEVTFELVDGFAELLLGLRRFEDERDRFQLLDPLENQFPGLPFGLFGDQIFEFSPNPAENRSATFTSTNPRVNLKLNVSDRTNVYFNYATGFRSGFFSPQSNTDTGVSLGLDPEFVAVTIPDEVETFELGLKTVTADGRFSADIALFQTEHKDRISIVSGIGGVAVVANLTDAEITGLEWVLSWMTPVTGLSLGFSGAYLDGELDPLEEIVTNPAFENTVYRPGGPIPSLQEFSWEVHGSYDWTLDNGFEMSFYLEYRDFDEQADANGDLSHRTFPGQSVTSPGYELVNAELALMSSDDWAIRLFGNNLTNNDDPIGYSNGRLSGVSRPLTFGLTYERFF